MNPNLLGDVAIMKYEHLAMERAWRHFVMAIAPGGILNLIFVTFEHSAFFGAINAIAAIVTSIAIVHAARKIQFSREVVAECAIFMAEVEGEE